MRACLLVMAFWIPTDPPLSDLEAFPLYAASNDTLLFMGQYRKTLQGRQMLEPWRSELWQEIPGGVRAWELLRESHIGCKEDRRKALGLLRDLLGPADYLHGRMPAPVPLWRFQIGE